MVVFVQLQRIYDCDADHGQYKYIAVGERRFNCACAKAVGPAKRNGTLKKYLVPYYLETIKLSEPAAIKVTIISKQLSST